MIRAILTIKGGTGKTTTTLNLAAGLADAGRRTLLIDLDGQANCTEMLLQREVKDGEITIGDCLSDPNLTPKAIIDTGFGFDLVPSNLNLFTVEKSILLDPSRSQHLRLGDAIARVENNYDEIIIDCNRSLGILATNAILACRSGLGYVIVPYKVGVGDYAGLAATYNYVQELNKNYDYAIEIKCLHTMVPYPGKYEIEAVEELRAAMPDKWLNTVIRMQPIAVGKASHKGEFLVRKLVRSNKSVGDDYRALVRELLGGNA